MDHFQYQGGVLHAEEVPLPRIAEAVGTPFYCYSTATLERHYNVLAEGLAPVDPLICFAVKANSNIAVLQTLGALGSGADVVSQGEIIRCLKAGIPAAKIVFSGVGKTREEMAFALDQGICQFNVESLPELKALNEVALRKGTVAPVAIRVNPDVEPGTHAKISTGQKSSKFGIDAAHATEVFGLAKSLPNIELKGLSVHIGSQLTRIEPFRAAFERVRKLAEELRAEGFTIETLDLGGGLGVPYDREAPPSPAEYAKLVVEVFEGFDARLIFEPGRMICANAGILVSEVLYVKEGSERFFAILDAAENDLLRPAMYHAWHAIVPVREKPGEKPFIADIVGPVCETGDIFAEQREIAYRPAAGELWAIRTAGAYGAVMANSYNSRRLVPEVLVKGDEFAVIRDRQSYDDMLMHERLPDWSRKTKAAS